MKKLISFCLFTLVIVFVFSVVLPVYSNGIGQEALEKLGATGQAAGISSTYTVEGIIGLIIRTVLSLIGIVMVVLIIYGGFLWMTAAGDEKKVDKAKKILSNAVIGLVIVLAAYSIAWFVTEKLLGATMTQ